VVFFPPALTLHAVVEGVRDRTDIVVGVQNIYWEDKGAFTGELSASMARDAGARLVLVGHSERRHVFGERDEDTGKKCQAAVRAGVTPVLCVGETIAERDQGRTEEVVLRQLRAGIAGLTPAQVRDMLIAYEPVWAIGTGKTATPDDAAVVHAVIRTALKVVVADDAAKVPILYGGSVNRANASTLLAAPNVDGLLVGGASLDAGGWAAIARA
jgi:triosephosphate isomerase